MATADKVVVELQAKTDAYISGIKKADAEFTAKVGHMEKEANDLANAVNRAGQRSGQAFSKIASDAPRAANAIKGMAGQTGNLAAQLNDIGVQLAGGTSPFLIAIQQGSQINQVLGGAGAGGAVRALGAAFGSLVNPVGLATFAIIGLGGAAVQYFVQLLSDSGKAEMTLKEQADLIRKVADRWGDALPALKAYSDELDNHAERAEISAASEAAINAEFEKTRDLLPDIKTKIGTVAHEYTRLGENKTARLLKDAFNELDVATQDLNKAFTEGKNVGEAFENFQQKLANLLSTTAVSANEELRQSVTNLGVAYENAAGSARMLAGETEKLLRSYEGSGELLRRGLDFGVGNLPGTAPAPDLGGQRQGDIFFGNAGDSIAEAMIKKFEGFRSNAYWDVNAFRTGYGSDTRTDAVTGEVTKVTKDTLVSLADANRDLSRRIVEFQDGIRKSIGSDRFEAFTQEQQAALTSIAYNYGSLPDKIVAAIMSGGDVAGAIRGLSANKSRRAAEADVFAGFGASTAAPTGTGSKLHTDPLAGFHQDPWAGLREKTTGQIALNKELQASYDALAQVGVTAINGIANALADGKIEGEELLQIVLQIVQQLLTMPRIGGAGGGIFGGLLIPGILHKGGVAGRDGYGHGRAVSPSVFSGAQRMHGGGMAGLRSGEVPAILQRGEMVIPSKGRGSGGGKITLHVIGEPGPEFAPRIRAEAQGVSVRVMSAYDKNLNRTLGDRMTNATARQR